MAGERPVLVAPNWWIGILPRNLWRKKKIFFCYEADFTPIAAGTLVGVDVNTQIQADSDFLMLGLNALVTDTANPPVIVWGSAMTNNAVSNHLVQIRDVATGQNLFQTPVPLDNVAGSGPFPAPIGLPYLFSAASTITTTLSDTASAVAAHNVRLTYWGVRVYTQIQEA
jgi:hypothetical protein